MKKNYEAYKVYANVAYEWYVGNSDLKKATKISVILLTLLYITTLTSIYYYFRDSANMIYIVGVLFMAITFIFSYIFKEVYNLLLICNELESQLLFWKNNELQYKAQPTGLMIKEQVFLLLYNLFLKKN